MKQYAERDHMALDEAGNYYCRHVSAMTAEGLHAKSDIAAELAWRDMEIARLKRESVEWQLIVEGALAALEDTPGVGYFSATASALRKTIAAAIDAVMRE